MAGTSPNGGESSSEIGIPTGLNRIKTRRVLPKDQLSSIPAGDSYKLTDSRSHGVSRPLAKQRSVGQGHLKINGSKEGLRRGKKIARWFTSHLFKGPDQAFNYVPPDTEYSVLEVKALSKEGPSPSRTQLHKVGKHSAGKQFSPESSSSCRVAKVLKSFSHELGPKGGIPPASLAHPRAHSYNDLKELLGSLRSRFDAAKEVVNEELTCFAREVKEILLKNYPFSPEGQKMAKELLILAEQCVEMTSLEFRAMCEIVVLDLTEKRKQCQTGLLKWLLTRMLFILTRCTRLLHFERDSEPIDEKSLHNFKKCLESIPCVEMSWVSNPEISDTGSGYALSLMDDAKHELCHTSSKNDFMVIEQNSQIDTPSNVKQYQQVDENFNGELINRHTCGSIHEQEGLVDGSDSVICRICEEAVPASHLESHSYICAYADKCDLMKCLDIDERLLKLAEMLEQIIESRNLTVHASYDSPEASRTQNTNSVVPSEGYSPSMISEWRSKGVEGMFEDIHEMDTACIDDSHLATIINLKGHLGMKLGHCGPPSSTGSMTSLSSTNTPRAGHFDFFWLEQNNPSELEDVQQMIDLVDIAHCVAGTDLSKEGSHEYLLACMEDLQDILQHSKLKALVIDTFGGRMESLMREKYLLACELMDSKSLKNSGRETENSKFVLDHSSQSSTTSTPAHPLHKERTSIDDFEIIKPISRGAFGKVFLARKRITRDLFAIKVLKKLDMIRKNDIERILAERNILITVRNPFVVRFFYSFTSRDHLYLVMEYLNGGDLYSLLRKVGCLEEDVARIYIAELVLALEYLHSLGIVHRDLKPDNILIANDGHIKLTDFGLSKIGLMNSTGDLPGPETEGIDAYGQHNEQTENNSQRSAVGTPDYLAPEILLGTEHGYAADWWSVGIILFESITGIPPFAAERPEIIFDNILNRKIPWPSVPNDMSYEAQDLIDRFLVHDPDQRLGARGSSEVKAHSFFRGVNWDTLELQKAAFVPQPDGIDDTSYFVPRYTQLSAEMPDDQCCSDSASDMSDSYSNSGVEKMDECGDLAQFNSSPLDLSLMNFSFKNLAQLASMNRDVLLQSSKDASKCSSPCKCPDR